MLSSYDALPFQRDELRQNLKPAVAPLHPVILCVDDRASAFAMRKMVLEKSGYTVLSAACGDQALKLLRSAHVDLVLSDYYLRGESGTAIVTRIKALRPNIPVLILSGSADALDETEHVDGIISEMDQPTNLLVSIARALGL
jgi:CheY-like chemotaxis protein